MNNQNRVEQSNDPKFHAQRIRKMMKEVIDHIEEDEKRVDEPQAEALFETTREVLGGLVKAYDHYETKSEKVWER